MRVFCSTSSTSSIKSILSLSAGIIILVHFVVCFVVCCHCFSVGFLLGFVVVCMQPVGDNWGLMEQMLG